MIKNNIEYDQRFGYSKLFRDFIYQPGRLTQFFEPIHIKERIDGIARGAHHRDAAVNILKRQNENWQAPPQVMKSIDKLSDKNAVAVVAGQQACLFGGAYMVILKAMAAAKLARKLEDELSIPVVPIFWIAAEDHDFQEISYVDVFDTAGALKRLTIDGEGELNHPPIGTINYGQSIEREVSRLQTLLPDNDFKGVTIGQIKNIYRSGKNISDCFAEYIMSLIGHFGIALFNSYDAEFKKNTVPIFKEVASRYADIKQVLGETEKNLLESGYHIQVQKSKTAAHLFYHTPDRTAIHFDGDKFAAGGENFSVEELTGMIEKQPLDFSPDALIRPVIQSSFFPTAAVIAGPAEVAYYAQMMSLFEAFGLLSPEIVARSSMTLVEKRFEKLLENYDLSLTDLAGDIEVVINKILQETYPVEIDQQLSKLSVNVNDELRKLKPGLGRIDPGLNDTVDRIGEKVDYQLKNLGQKIFTAHKRQNKVERDRLYRLCHSLYPNRGLAERSIAPAYLISRYGEKVIDFIYENITLDETGHQLLVLSEYHG